MKKVLIDRPLNGEALSLLSKHAEVVSIFDDDKEKLEKALRDHHKGASREGMDSCENLNRGGSRGYSPGILLYFGKNT